MYLPTEQDLSKYWGFDIEGDGLADTVSRVWCATAKNCGTGMERRFASSDEFRKFVEVELNEGCYFIAQNGIEYDFPVCNRLVGTKFTINRMIDTMVMSQVYSPSIDGGHSLAAWGVRLRFPKGEWNDFSKYSPEMEEYCMNDTRLLVLMFKALVSKMRGLGFTETGLEIEHRSWELIRQQRKNGFRFNFEEANKLYSQLRDIENELERKIHEFWPPRLDIVWTGAKAYRADGSFSSNYERHRAQYTDVRIRPDGKYDCYDYVYFNVGSSPQRVEKLLTLGWVNLPDEVTETGNPSPTSKGQLVPSLVKFVEDSGKEEVRLIARWMEINARANMINTWIEAYNHDTGCIHGRVWLANTLRYRHSNPNTANIPAVRLDGDNPLHGDAGTYTYEARDLWTVRSNDRVLVGVDAKGIQLRVLAHYLNNKDFMDAVLGGDPHSYNQNIGGFATRAIAKTYIYAYLLGAGDAKVGQIIGGSPKDGKTVKARFVANFPGLKKLMDNLQQQVDNAGRIVLCDGTPLLVRKPHTRLGYLLQGDESRIMKKAMITIARESKRRRLDALQVGFIHDELQFDVVKGDVSSFTDVCLQAFIDAGESFSYRLPIQGDVSIGATWAQSH